MALRVYVILHPVRSVYIFRDFVKDGKRHPYHPYGALVKKDGLFYDQQQN